MSLGTSYATFIVSLSTPATQTVSVNFGVDLKLFIEYNGRHWEADLSDPRLTAVPVAADTLQERARELVVPDGLPSVVAALKQQGVDVRSHYLEEVSFVVELARDVERALLKARPNGKASLNGTA